MSSIGLSEMSGAVPENSGVDRSANDEASFGRMSPEAPVAEAPAAEAPALEAPSFGRPVFDRPGVEATPSFGGGTPEVTILSMQPVDVRRERRASVVKRLTKLVLFLVAVAAVALIVIGG